MDQQNKAEKGGKGDRVYHLNDLNGLTLCHPEAALLSPRASRNTAQWFGVGEDCETKQQVWHRKSLRHCSQRYGKLKAQYREPETATSIDQSLESPATHRLPRVLPDSPFFSKIACRSITWKEAACFSTGCMIGCCLEEAGDGECEQRVKNIPGFDSGVQMCTMCSPDESSDSSSVLCLFCMSSAASLLTVSVSVTL